MQNLFEIMQRAGGGAFLDTLSRQYGLDPASTSRAVDALLPAFSLAFQQSTQNPERFAGLLQTMLSGAYAPFFDRAGSFPGRSGEDALRRLFGSPETVQDIAQRASEATGIGVKVLQEMMPVMAATLIGGMMRYATAEGFADLLRQWADVLKTVADKTHPAPRPKLPADPWSAWFDMISRMGGTSSAPQGDRAASTPFEAWSQAVRSAMGLSLPTGPAAAAPAQHDPFQALARIFETGREVQAQYLATLQALLSPTTDHPPKA